MENRLPRSLRQLAENKIGNKWLERQLADQNLEIVNLKRRALERNEEIVQLRGQRYNLEQSVHSLQADRQNLRDRIVRQHTQLRIHENNVSQIQNTQLHYQEELTKYKTALASLKPEIDWMSGTIENLRNQIAMAQEINELHGQ